MPLELPVSPEGFGSESELSDGLLPALSRDWSDAWGQRALRLLITETWAGIKEHCGHDSDTGTQAV